MKLIVSKDTNICDEIKAAIGKVHDNLHRVDAIVLSNAELTELKANCMFCDIEYKRVGDVGAYFYLGHQVVVE